MLDTSQNSRTIRLFLVDGSANGVITAEIMNWTGHAVVGPRSRLPELLERDEAARTGIYFLVGPDPESGSAQVYIGEGNNVGERLRDHAQDARKDFWEKGCFFTSKDQNLTKAHGRYLESRLYGITHSAGRATLANSNKPDAVALPEADLSDMEYFIKHIQLVLPVLGMDFLRPTRASNSKATSQEVVFELNAPKHSIGARAVQRDDEIVVLKGSSARPTWSDAKSKESGYAQQHSALLKNKRINLGSGGGASFSDDVPFKSLSAAAAVVLGRKANGRLEWKVEGTEKSYADWEIEQLDASRNQDQVV